MLFKFLVLALFIIGGRTQCLQRYPRSKKSLSSVHLRLIQLAVDNHDCHRTCARGYLFAPIQRRVLPNPCTLPATGDCLGSRSSIFIANYATLALSGTHNSIFGDTTCFAGVAHAPGLQASIVMFRIARIGVRGRQQLDALGGTKIILEHSVLVHRPCVMRGGVSRSKAAAGHWQPQLHHTSENPPHNGALPSPSRRWHRAPAPQPPSLQGVQLLHFFRQGFHCS